MQWLKIKDTTNVKRSNKLQFEGQTIKCQNEKRQNKNVHTNTLHRKQKIEKLESH